MKQFKLSIGSPLYEEKYVYSKKRTVKMVKDECRKHLILRLTIRLFDKAFAEKFMERVISDLAALTGYTEVVNLSELDWGVPPLYNEEKGEYVGSICIPKDFDNMSLQKEFLTKTCKEYETSLNEQYGIHSAF